MTKVAFTGDLQPAVEPYWGNALRECENRWTRSSAIQITLLLRFSEWVVLEVQEFSDVTTLAPASLAQMLVATQILKNICQSPCDPCATIGLSLGDGTGCI